MEFEWDRNKNESNFKKHGIWFEEAAKVFEGIVLSALSDNHNYEETRKISIGEILDIIIIVLIHTERNGKTRIISARRANKNERSKYHEYIKNIKKKKS